VSEVGPSWKPPAVRRPRVVPALLRPATRGFLGAVLALLLVAAQAGAAAVPSTGRFRGTTGDGHVIEFTVERSAKAGFARKITRFHVVYDIAGCRSGPVRQPFFASVRTGGPTARRGMFSRVVGRSATTNQLQLRLTGRFTSPTRASGSFRVGVVGRCPIEANAPPLSFTARRR
jgi:hypothetical protein